MRVAPSLGIAVLLTSMVASASVTQPNGLIMPVDSVNGEVQLYTFFALRGEPIDWLSDAHETPGVFSPLCGLTTQFVLHQAGFNYAMAWYNVTGAPPAPADFHVLIPPGSPVGATVSADVKNDPAYAGGAIGFALLGGQTHYSEVSLNQVCTNCAPAGPWIAALVYASKTTPDAFYVAFEDGPMGASGNSFNNDGDYNDDVYFVTGLSCEGANQSCDTGVSGVCAKGVTHCAGGGLVCQPVAAATTEACNGLDDDCDGTTDEDATCAPGSVCHKGTCVSTCNGGGGACSGDEVCNAAGICVDPLCESTACDPGEVCVAGACQDPCAGVVCPHAQSCRAGVCVDSCANVGCQPGEVCDDGICLAGCSCAGCGPGLTCEPASEACVDTACAGVPCGAGTFCAAGQCIDSCSGAQCPVGETCEMGQCVAVPDGTGGGAATSSSTVGSGGEGLGGQGGGGAGAGPSATASSSSVGGLGVGGGGSSASLGAAGGDASVSGEPTDAGGCGCRFGGTERGYPALAVAALAALHALRRRSRVKHGG